MDKREKLDVVFSKYIRLRDCPNGIGHCITCGAAITPNNCDAGHYISRRKTATRWNEANVHAQCYKCNRHEYGQAEKFRIALIAKYGLAVVEELENISKNTVRLRDGDYNKLIDYYQLKLKQI